MKTKKPKPCRCCRVPDVTGTDGSKASCRPFEIVNGYRHIAVDLNGEPFEYLGAVQALCGERIEVYNVGHNIVLSTAKGWLSHCPFGGCVSIQRGEPLTHVIDRAAIEAAIALHKARLGVLPAGRA